MLWKSAQQASDSEVGTKDAPKGIQEASAASVSDSEAGIKIAPTLSNRKKEVKFGPNLAERLPSFKHTVTTERI